MTKETKAQLIAARTHERARLLKLVESFERSHNYWAAAAAEERAHAVDDQLASRAELRKDLYAEVVLALRAALRIDEEVGRGR